MSTPNPPTTTTDKASSAGVTVPPGLGTNANLQTLLAHFAPPTTASALAPTVKSPAPMVKSPSTQLAPASSLAPLASSKSDSPPPTKSPSSKSDSPPPTKSPSLPGPASQLSHGQILADLYVRPVIFISLKSPSSFIPLRLGPNQSPETTLIYLLHVDNNHWALAYVEPKDGV
ncbi:hypothetical protein PtB15_11B491 [Puccinia triticina]|nr:hypothetical protein PtB15_11B491 [Puccinia triticina]